MTTILSRPSIRILILAMAAATLLFFFSSCSKKVSFLTSSVVPAAEGNVKVKKDNNNNYHIDIEVANLAEPNRLQPAKSTYVVWMESDNNEVKNIGQINSSTAFMSKKLKASFETVSAVKPSKIYLTAEDNASVQYPGTQVVLSTNSF